MKKNLIIMLGLMLTLLMNAQNLGKESKIDSVLASVNGEPITLLDVMLESNREEMRLANLYSGARLYTEVNKLRKAIVEEIIIRKLVYAQYKEKPFPIENQYIEDMIDQLAVSMGGGSRETLIRKAKAMGTTLQELREKSKEKLAVDIMLREFCDRPVYITPKEVYDHYQKNSKEWTIPTRYDLSLLQISRSGGRSGNNPQESCRKLADQLKNADSDTFVRLVKANSDAPNADKGGSVGEIDQDKLRPEFMPVVIKMKPNMIAGPIETPEGFYFIRLNRVKAEEKQPFEKVSDEITKQLEKEQKIKMRKEYTEKIKKNAIIRYYF